MSFRIVNRPGVRADIISAVEHYKSISPRLAEQFLNRLREARIYIAKTPEGFQVKYKEVRTLLLKQFPYHVHYLIDAEKKLIVILAIIHAYKNPRDYTGR